MWARRRGGVREPENVWQHGSTAVVLSQSVAARCMHNAVGQEGTLGVAAGEFGGPVREASRWAISPTLPTRLSETACIPENDLPHPRDRSQGTADGSVRTGRLRADLCEEVWSAASGETAIPCRRQGTVGVIAHTAHQAAKQACLEERNVSKSAKA